MLSPSAHPPASSSLRLFCHWEFSESLQFHFCPPLLSAFPSFSFREGRPTGVRLTCVPFVSLEESDRFKA